MSVIMLMKAYIIFVLGVMVVYILRHLLFSMNRVVGPQRVYYQDIMDPELPSVTVIVPMHNEETVARHILELLLEAEYPADRLEIIPVNDHSEDGTAAILDEYAARCPRIRPLHRAGGRRGKPAALNEALPLARGEVIIVFDADYLPARGIIRDIAISFKDPEIGAVMGRVVPLNMQKNFLTRLLGLERSAGYQVDQQARQNLRLIPQYGGTVGGFRKDVALSFGGFTPSILAEDTELTFQMLINGWKVMYNNRVECYEEVPEDWDTRVRQLKRWARGHTQVMITYIGRLIRSRYMTFWEKADGILLMFLYVIPIVLLAGTVDVVALFYLNQTQLFESIFLFLGIAGFNIFGNFAPFYQVGTASMLDGFTYRIRLLPFVLFNSLFNIYYSAQGAMSAFGDQFFKREALWEKTSRYRQS